MDRPPSPTGPSSHRRDLEVLVVGAGPGGVAAALTAQRLGLRVVVVDQHTFPRDKTCGDGLTAGALRQLEALGLDVPTVPGYQSVGHVELVSPSGRRVALPMPAAGEYSAVVRRLALDAAMVDHARAAGIEIREGAALVGLHEQADALYATFDDGSELASRHVIAADGHWSTVRRLREPDRPRDLGTWHAARQYFRGVADARQWVFFNAALLPGYAWVFPLPNGRANVGFCVLRNPRPRGQDHHGEKLNGRRAADLWRAVLDDPRLRETLGPDAEPEGRLSAWPIPAAFDASRVSDGRVLYVGDAAGVVDPMTGEGIAQALETGVLAATALAGSGPGAVGDRYTRDVRRALGRDLWFAAALQRVLRSPLGARAAIATAGLTGWTRRNFARWMFEDYPRAAVLTPSRWKRGLFSAPGAFAADRGARDSTRGRDLTH